MPTKDFDLVYARLLRPGERQAIALLMRTGAFTEQDVHMMLRGQVLLPPCDGLAPCLAGDPELEDPDEPVHCLPRTEDQLHLRGPLDPVPAARNLLRCPLHERGRRGDLLVPCFHAQKSPVPSAGLPPEQRDAILYFRDTVEECVLPCRLLHKVLWSEFLAELHSPNLLLHVKDRPPEAPPAPGDGDLQQQTLLQYRQAALNGDAQLEEAGEQQRRSLLLFLLRSGRLTLREIQTMVDRVVQVTDEGWLPCRDDPLRNISLPPGEPDDDEDYEYIPRVRLLCPLQERAQLGDRTVPCAEALQMAPDPEMIERERIFQEACEAERKAEGQPLRAKMPLPRSWSGTEDQPGGPRDIVNLLNIRPCHLVGRVAASYLCNLRRHVLAHPEEAAEPK